MLTNNNSKHMKKKFKTIPKFKNEDEERAFWATADTSNYFDYSKAERAIFPNLKPSTKSISLRLPEIMIARLKQAANSMDIPYQSLMKIFLADKLNEKFGLTK